MNESIQILWAMSLAAEFGALWGIFHSAWRKMYPKFFTYLVFDLTTSIALYWVAMNYPGAYDMPWRVIQCLLVAGRLCLVIESYEALAPTKTHWRITDGFVYPIACLGTILFHIAMIRPLRWPSGIELVFQGIGASHCLMGFVMIGILSASHRTNLRGTVQDCHAKILCAYFLLTAPCYYLAAQHIQYVGIVLAIVATLCYSSWLYLAGISKHQRTKESR